MYPRQLFWPMRWKNLANPTLIGQFVESPVSMIDSQTIVQPTAQSEFSKSQILPPPSRWRCDQARIRTDRLHIEWSWMKPVTLTCLTGQLTNWFFNRIIGLVIMMVHHWWKATPNFVLSVWGRNWRSTEQHWVTRSFKNNSSYSIYIFIYWVADYTAGVMVWWLDPRRRV